MNLEEKAEQYAKPHSMQYFEFAKIDFKAGYNECKSDLLDFLKANPKADNKQITEYLNSL